jgi:hypothetical protein
VKKNLCWLLAVIANISLAACLDIHGWKYVPWVAYQFATVAVGIVLDDIRNEL